MNLSQRAAAVFDVQPGEGRNASLMLAHAFAMGLATVFFETAASALFLARYPSSLLPWVYIAAAIVNTTTGLVYTALQSRMGFARLMQGTLLFLLVVTLVFRAGIAWTDSAAMVFGLLVFYRVVSILTDLEYWAVAARLYDVRQAKRLFGFIGSGEVIARIGGSFSVPLLVHALGVANLLLLSGVALFASLLLAGAVLRRASVDDPQAPGTASSTARPAARPGALSLLRDVLADRYLKLLVVVVFFGVLGKYFVDFAFLEQMKSRYAGASELATFFGLFSGFTQVGSLLARAFLSGRVLKRYGVGVGLVILPLTHLACTLLLVGAGLLDLGAAVFWLVIANQGVYKVLKHPVDSPSIKVLYQPLQKSQRLAMQVAVETLVTPVTFGLAGVVMLLFATVVPYDPTVFAAVLLLTFAGWAWFAHQAGHEYAGALAGALKGRVEDVEFTFENEAGLRALKSTLFQGKPSEILFAMELLEKSLGSRLAPALQGLEQHPAPEVRTALLQYAGRQRLESLLPFVERSLASDSDPLARAAALTALAAIVGPAAEPRIAPHLSDPDPGVVRAALIALLRQGADFANHYLADRARSRRPEKRLWAARVIADVGEPRRFREPLARLLEDPAADVRRAALSAAARVRDHRHWPAVIEALRDRVVAGAAENTLVAAGDQVLEAVAEALRTAGDRQVARRATRVVGRIRGAAPQALLFELLSHPEALVRGEALTALTRAGAVAEGPDRDRVEALLDRSLADAARKLATLDDLDDDDAVGLVRQALDSELRAAGSRVLLMLALLNDPVVILRARDHLGDAAREKRAYALELLEVTLGPNRFAQVHPLLTRPTDPKRTLVARYAPARTTRVERLGELIVADALWMAPWTRACAAAAGVRLGLPGIDLTLSQLRAQAPGDTFVGDSTTVALRKASAAMLDTVSVKAGGDVGRGLMLAIEKVIILKSVNIFGQVSEDVLADVGALLEEVAYQPGQVIFEAGEQGDSMYIIIEGRVRVYDGERTIVELGERDIFGELALLDPEPRSASIAALQPTRLFRLDREAFLELMAGSPEIVRGVLHVLCERLRQTAKKAGGYQDKERPSGQDA